MSLKMLVNQKEIWEAFCKELDSEISVVHKALEQATSTDAMYRLQGEIRAYRKLKYLRDKVNG